MDSLLLSRVRTTALAALMCATLAAPIQAQQLSWEFDPEAIQALEQAATGAAAQLLRNASLQSRGEALRAGGGSDQSLQLNVIRYGERAAITLVDVVVFAEAFDATANAELWVHELWHVQQFAQWGVDDFSLRYARDYRRVEAEAEAAAARFLAARRR